MIEVSNVAKSYIIKRNKESGITLFKRKEKVVALDSVSFTLENGKTTCVLGANGAGKSTLIKIMTGLLTPDTGTVSINGKNPFENRTSFLKELGIVFGQRSQLWWELPVIDSFTIIKKMYDVEDTRFEKNLAILDQYFQITTFLHRTVRSLSLGQRMLCDLASVFIHNPSVIFLDEPTIGLDVSIKNKMYEFIRYLNTKTNTSIVLTTHDMSDIRALSDRVIIIDKGNILFDGEIEQISTVFKHIKLVNVTLLDDSLDELNTILQRFKLISHQNKTGVIMMEVNTERCNLNLLLSELHGISNLVEANIELPDIEFILAKVYSGDLDD